ncbi:MAG TPA: cytochrome C oxidase subunit IV family protein [Acidimicrobiales bacterium]|nr:cytochrome C oxidase subunit IV family protein [Acidimicrobiales bacterium]
MSTATDHDTEVHGHGLHPTEKQYVVIGLILAALTSVEVGLYYVNIGKANTPVLLILAIVKFAIVAMYFMHLKFDNAILRRLFVTGIVTAIGVYTVYLITLGALF